MQDGRTRVEHTGQVSRRKRMGVGKRTNITETKSKTDKSYRDKMRKETDTGKWTK